MIPKIALEFLNVCRGHLSKGGCARLSETLSVAGNFVDSLQAVCRQSVSEACSILTNVFFSRLVYENEGVDMHLILDLIH